MKNENSIDRIIQINDTNIGNNIAALRKSLNIKQTDMIARLQTDGIDISIYSYNRIEKGSQNPTAKKAKNIKLIVNAYPNVRIVLNTFIFFIPGSFLLILR